MAHVKGQTVTLDGRKFIVTGYHYGFQLLIIKEIGRNFETMCEAELLNN